MGMMVQFPSPALWQQVLSTPSVTKDQGTRNPRTGFDALINAQLANQPAVATLHPQPRPIPVRKDVKDAKDQPRDRQQAREQDRDPNASGHQAPAHEDATPRPLVRGLWA